MIRSKKNKEHKYTLAKIKVVGIGGAGGNALSRMSVNFPKGVDFVALNTDLQDLNHCLARKKICIGRNLTRGLGTGMNPDLGRQAAEETQSEITQSLEGTDMVFLTAGYGGGTGTGALPIVAEIAKDLGVITIAIVTKPFSFEGFERMKIAEEGIARTIDKVDTLITVSNDKIFSLIDKNTSLNRAFEAIDEVLKNSVLGIAELLAAPGLINVDFADVKAIIKDAGSAVIGIGVAAGAERAVQAANAAIHSPLLENSIDGAKRVLFSVSGRDLKMTEINEIARLISENVDHSAKIIFGVHHDRKLKKGELKLTIVAAGFNGNVIRIAGPLANLFASEPAVNLKFKSEGLKSKEEIKNKDKEAEMLRSNILEGSKKKEESEKGDVWDIPTFLRKKKR